MKKAMIATMFFWTLYLNGVQQPTKYNGTGCETAGFRYVFAKGEVCARDGGCVGEMMPGRTFQCVDSETGQSFTEWTNYRADLSND